MVGGALGLASLAVFEVVNTVFYRTSLGVLSKDKNGALQGRILWLKTFRFRRD